MCKSPSYVRLFLLLSLPGLGVACSSSTSSVAPIVRATATPAAAATPTPSPSPAVAASSQAVTQVVTAGTALPLPTVAGFGGSIEFKAGSSIPAGAELLAQTFAGAPASAPAPQARRRSAATPAPAASPLVLVSELLRYTGIPASVVPLFANIPTVETFTGPQFVAGQQYQAELFDETTGVLVQATGGFVSGNTANFIDAVAGMTTLDPYLLEVVENSALPTPVPTASVSPTSTAAPTATPEPSPSASGSATPTASPVSDAKLYVANFYPGTTNEGSITIYSANVSGTLDEVPLATITGSNTALDQPAGVAVDGNGRIYAVNTRITTRGQASVNVYPANPSGTVNEAPIAQITGSNTGLGFPEGIAIDASGKIYVANTSNSITVYAANPSGTLNEAPLATISGGNTGLNVPDAVALDASGRIYVANGNSNTVTVYAANPSGTLNEAPLATIAGSATSIDQPTGVAVDSSGRIYVANTAGSGAVTIFASNPAGLLNESPIATLTNTEAGYTAAGIALDTNGNVFVSNDARPDIKAFVFPPTPLSTEPPFGTITGSATHLVSPLGMTIR